MPAEGTRMRSRILMMAGLCSAVGLACAGPKGDKGEAGDTGPQGMAGQQGPPGAPAPGGNNLFRWVKDPAQWALASGTQGTIALVGADSLEGDAAFELNLTSGTTGSQYTFGDFIAVDPRRTYGGRISTKLVNG